MSRVKASDGLWFPRWSALVLRLFSFNYSLGLKTERSTYSTGTVLGKNAVIRPMNFCLLGKGTEENCTPGIGEGNVNALQCSCLENPRDGGACWAAVYGVAQSRTRLKWLSSSSNSLNRVYWNPPPPAAAGRQEYALLEWMLEQEQEWQWYYCLLPNPGDITNR